MPPAKRSVGLLPSSSAISNATTNGPRPRTRSSSSCSPRPAPRSCSYAASALTTPPGCWSRSATSPASPARRTSPPGPAPPPSTPPPATTSGTGSRGLETGRSTTCCTSWPSSNYATKPKDAPTSTARKTPARPRWKRCAASSDACPTSSTGNYSPTCSHQQGRAREGTRGRHTHAAWPTHIPTSTLRISHFPDPSPPSLGPHPSPRLDIEGSQYSCIDLAPVRTNRSMAAHVFAEDQRIGEVKPGVGLLV